jgi:hypothetical protein
MTSRRMFLAAIAILVMASCAATAFAQSEPVFFTPTPYLSADDIPADFYAGGAPDVLEDFEDGSLDPSMYAHPGGIRGPGTHCDSVDADDGEIDGFGFDGTSWAATDGSGGIKVHFEQPYPTAAAMVWTDGYGEVTFEAFDEIFDSLGTVGPVDIADDSQDGTTAEDHFFGVHYAEGISSIRLTCISGNIEVDHVQYGSAGTVVSVPEQMSVVRLGQNVPNPFNPQTTIQYALTQDTQVDLRIFDLAGRLVETLEMGEMKSAGTNYVTWTGRDAHGRVMPSGTYFYCLEALGYTETKRMTLIR